MKIERLGPHFGAKIHAVDLRQFTAGDREQLRALMEEHLVLFFTGQNLEPLEFQRFGAIVGDLEPPDEAAPTVPTLDGDLKRINYIDVSPDIPRGTYSDQWHTDVTFFERPSYAVLMQPAALPPLGGDTLWASMYAAYEALPASLRDAIEDLSAVHAVEINGKPVRWTHPVVRVNPLDGRRGLYVNRLFSTKIEGFGTIESAYLLELLFNHCALPDFQIRFRWSPDIVVLWDNRFTTHYAVRDYSERRRMLRMALAGDRPIGPREYAAQARNVAA
jgi:taurine dioxygenase